MNIKDLMIGDWVSITEPDDFHGFIGRVTIINSETGYVTVSLECYHPTDVLCDDLQPIELTPELMRKCGYEELTGLYRQGDRVLFRINGAGYVKFYQGDVDFVDCVDDSGDYGYEDNYLCDVKYVHSLQHAFKLFDIEQDIKLTKEEYYG